MKKGILSSDTKARMKKAANAKKNWPKKQIKAKEKPKAKNLGTSEMIQLAISNRQAKVEIGVSEQYYLIELLMKGVRMMPYLFQLLPSILSLYWGWQKVAE